MSSAFIRKFSDDLAGASPATIGGKAFSLVNLYQKNYPVPNGFIISTQAFDFFLQTLSGRNTNDSLSQAHKEITPFAINSAGIQQEIVGGDMPPQLAEIIQDSLKALDAVRVAVRSSATVEDGERCSYAGQFESFLGVSRQDILLKVKRCWSSLFGRRAVIYSGNTYNIGKMAVIVQEMVEADISGVCFSVNPVNHDINTVIVELVQGLGDTLVQGAVTPSRYMVSKNDLIIREKQVAKIDDISDTILKEIVHVVIKIEDFYNKPVDMEFAVKDGLLYILQARPITALRAV